MLAALPLRAGAGPTLFPVDVAARLRRAPRHCGRRRGLRGARALAREKVAEAERRLEASPPAILPAFVPLGALSLDLERLERNAAQPFDPPREASPLRRQWAIWRWYDFHDPADAVKASPNLFRSTDSEDFAIFASMRRMWAKARAEIAILVWLLANPTRRRSGF